MTVWCPRCDAVREPGRTCPVCGTALEVLGATPPPPAPDDLAVEPEPAPPAAPRSRLRLALVVATVAVAGLAFLAGKGSATPPPPASPRPTAAPPPTAERPALQRQLGWTARSRGGLTVTAVALYRAADGDPDVGGRLVLRVSGLPPGDELLGLRGLELTDLGGGAFATPPGFWPGGGELDRPGDVAVFRDGPPGTYGVGLGVLPDLGQLASVRIDALRVSAKPAGRVALADRPAAATSGRPRPLAPSGAGQVEVRLPAGFGADTATLRLRVASAFVGGGKADVVVGITGASLDAGPPDRLVAVTARLLAGGRLLCARTVRYRPDDLGADPAFVLSCPSAPATGLSVDLGAGTATLPLSRPLLRPGG